MKKGLLVIFAICLPQAMLLGCDTCLFRCNTEPPEPPTLEPFYVNNSGVPVKLIVKDVRVEVDSDSNYSTHLYPIGEQEIKNNDTLCNENLKENCAIRLWQIAQGYEGWESIKFYNDSEPAYFKIEFLSEPKICLVFDGDDKVENDIRYWENYTLIKKQPTVHFYSYTITPNLMQQAKAEYCKPKP